MIRLRECTKATSFFWRSPTYDVQSLIIMVYLRSSSCLASQELEVIIFSIFINDITIFEDNRRTDTSQLLKIRFGLITWQVTAYRLVHML